jgi:hypothetical protein
MTPPPPTYTWLANVTCSGVCVCQNVTAATAGSISDGPSNYPNNAKCMWLLALYPVPLPSKRRALATDAKRRLFAAESCTPFLSLAFTSLETETGRGTAVEPTAVEALL